MFWLKLLYFRVVPDFIKKHEVSIWRFYILLEHFRSFIVKNTPETSFFFKLFVLVLLSELRSEFFQQLAHSLSEIKQNVEQQRIGLCLCRSHPRRWRCRHYRKLDILMFSFWRPKDDNFIERQRELSIFIWNLVYFLNPMYFEIDFFPCSSI